MKNDFILAVLEDVCEKLDVSQSLIDCDTDSPFFEDSCKVIEARHIVLKLISTIKFLDKYAKD